ncbi:MAG: hypothetical protein HFF18_14305 [Oscillospiraceae bacterium]|nr:hypothetical protein [Oscillospiraceae bacterium]
MRRIAALLALLLLLSLSALAAYVPEEVISENRDGRQLIIKTYTLSPQEDPAGLKEEPFDLDGFHYVYMETTKEEQAFQESRQQSETVTLETRTNDLTAILAELPQTREYAQDGYYGILTLDHTSLKTEASGYVTKTYTVTDTRQFTGLARNDPSLIPVTTVKNGVTLSLSNVTWQAAGVGLGDPLAPSSYTATAAYTGTGTQRAPTGYVATAVYAGEVTAQGIGAVKYTVAYLGTPVEPEPEPEPSFPWSILVCAVLLALTSAGVGCFFWFRPNAAIYAMNAKGVAYKKLGARRMTVRSPKLDLTKLREYPAGEASVELKQALAHKLAGRIVTIQLYDGTRTHLVEPYEGTDSYWFAIKETEESEP